MTTSVSPSYLGNFQTSRTSVDVLLALNFLKVALSSFFTNVPEALTASLSGRSVARTNLPLHNVCIAIIPTRSTFDGQWHQMK